MNISVVIPCYNGQKFLKEAIASINNQTLQAKEIVIVNDGSKDDSLEIICELSRHNPIPIKLVGQENGGVSSARNIGVAAASGDWIAFLDVDDLWYPEKLATQAKIIEESSKRIALVCCDYHNDFQDEMHSKYRQSAHVQPLLGREVEGEEFQLAFIAENFIGTATAMMFRRDLALRNGCFDVYFNHSEDFDFILRLSQFGTVYLDNEPMALKRHHGENLTDDLALYYFSHSTSLLKNIRCSNHYFRTSFSKVVIDAMRFSYDECLIQYANQMFERDIRKGLKEYLGLVTKLMTLKGYRNYVVSFTKKLIRTCSFGLIKNREHIG